MLSGQRTGTNLLEAQKASTQMQSALAASFSFNIATNRADCSVGEEVRRERNSFYPCCDPAHQQRRGDNPESDMMSKPISEL